MNRTQIYLEPELQTALRRRAIAEHRSVAAIIREAVREFMRPTNKNDADDPFVALMGRFQGGPKDGAKNHDKFLYAKRRKR